MKETTCWLSLFTLAACGTAPDAQLTNTTVIAGTSHTVLVSWGGSTTPETWSVTSADAATVSPASQVSMARMSCAGESSGPLILPGAGLLCGNSDWIGGEFDVQGVHPGTSALGFTRANGEVVKAGTVTVVEPSFSVDRVEHVDLTRGPPGARLNLTVGSPLTVSKGMLQVAFRATDPSGTRLDEAGTLLELENKLARGSQCRLGPSLTVTDQTPPTEPDWALSCDLVDGESGTVTITLGTAALALDLHVAQP